MMTPEETFRRWMEPFVDDELDETNREFQALKKKHGLTARQISEMLEITEHRVYNWCKSPSVESYRVTPAWAVKMLRMMVGDSQTGEESPPE